MHLARAIPAAWLATARGSIWRAVYRSTRSEAERLCSRTIWECSAETIACRAQLLVPTFERLDSSEVAKPTGPYVSSCEHRQEP